MVLQGVRGKVCNVVHFHLLESNGTKKFLHLGQYISMQPYEFVMSQPEHPDR